MQVTESSADGLKRELVITVGAKDLDDKLSAKLEELKSQVQLKGFRPGKVPMSHLRRTFGKRVMTEVIQETVSESSQKALQEKDLRPALQPSIDIDGEVEEVIDGKADLTFKMNFEIVPDITLADFSKVKLERPVADVAEDEVNEAVDRLAEQQTSYEKKEGKAEDKDLVVIDFVGKIDGEAFEGGSAEGARLVIGSGQFIPGFEEQLIGTEAGQDVEVKVTFPEEYGAEHLAGKDAVFEVKVTEVQAPVAAKLDDEFAQRFGMENLEKLRDAIKEQIGKDYARVSREKVKRTLLDELDTLHAFELPPTLVEQEFEQIWHQFEHELEHQGKTIADADEPEDKLREEYRSIAERRVRLGLVLAEVGEKNQIQVQDAEINQAIAERARQFPGQERQVYEYFSQNPQALAQVRAPLFEDKVVDFIIELADVTDKPVSKEELIASVEDEHDHDHDHDHDHGEEKKPAKKKAATKKAATKKTAAKKDDDGEKKPAAKKTATKKAATKKTASKKED
ncbi:trigger factor [Tepidicaulis sp. LMO-SS28]|uniref:trigger factor n=1 Tax=Tepidicaulis sp. LMO-SS28 TaxID=3447455 RepID=UPI003EE3B59B